MLCPICNVDLLMTEMQGIETDYCPKCRGIWLDKGELDQIIERASPEPQSFPDRENRDLRSGKDNKTDHEHGKRSESWFSRLLD
jgi:Zn-finger nucleic acid-binding protein